MFILFADKIGKERKKRGPKKKKTKEKMQNFVRLGYQSMATTKVTRNLKTLSILG